MCSDCRTCDNAHDVTHKKCTCESCKYGEHQIDCCPEDCSCLTTFAPDERREAERQYVMNVLEIFRDADLFMDSLMWGPHGSDGSYRFSAMCSDTFHWASADCETIEPEDLQMLGECLADLRVADSHGQAYLCELFASRKRGMRPMHSWLQFVVEYPAVHELFLQAGPERKRDWRAP